MKLSLKEIKEQLKSMLLEMSAVKTDKGVLQYEAEELAVGVEVKIVNEDTSTSIPVGEYVLEDGRTLVIEDGKIKEIIEKADEVAIEDVETKETTEQTELETEQPEEVVEETTEEVVEEEAEPTEIEKKVAELDNRLAELEKRVEEWIGQMENFNKTIEKLSMAKPVAEEFENVKTVRKTGNPKLDKFLEGCR